MSQQDHRQGRSRARALMYGGRAALVLIALLSATPALATHLRYSHVTWLSRTDIDPNAIDFNVQAVWRRSAFNTGNDRCIDAATLDEVACTGTDGRAGVGDIIHERQGNSKFDPGDSSGLIGGPAGLTQALLFLVSSVDEANDWLFGTALDPASLPAAAPPYDTSITHVYGSAGDRTAELTDCCRLSECRAPNAHMNNPDSDYRMETLVNVGSGKSSPVSNLPPIVLCPETGVCQFTIPVSDDDLDPLSFRLSTPSEADFVSQPGSPQCPNAASVDSVSGVYSWDTTGCNLAGDPLPEPPDGGCNEPTYNTLYSTQVMIEEPPGGSRVALDFLIQLVPTCQLGNQMPVFDGSTPMCGSTLSVSPGSNISFPVQSSDPDGGDVDLNVTGLPPGATMTPGLPVTGDPALSTFSWTPSTFQQGQHILVFNAVDDCSAQSLCSFTIDVSFEICDDGIDNDGDLLADCADPDCTGTTCDDGLYCTELDQCSAGVCTGVARDCDDGNACTADSCDESGDTCVQDSAAADGSACEDGQFCTDGDICFGGSCIGGGARDCSVFTADCNMGVCNESIDQCEPQPINDGGACDDGFFCTAGETCTGGVCGGGTALDCSDANICTLDSCDEGAGMCLNEVQPGCCGNLIVEAGEVCDDGNQIGGDGCEADCTLSTACSYNFGAGSEIFVGGCGAPSHGTIQDAINAAQEGDLISICPGVYAGGVVVDKEVTLRSTGGAAVTEVNSVGTAIDVRRSGVSIEGLTIVSDTAAAIDASSICRLGQSSCGTASGSNLLITDNVIRDSAAGIFWTSKVDCVDIEDNQLVANDAAIALLQAGGAPAILVNVGSESGGVGVGNTVQGGGSAGAAVEIAGIVVSVVANQIEDSVGDGLVVRDVPTSAVTLAANAVRRAAGAGIVLSQLGGGSTLVESDIDSSGAEGILVQEGATSVRIENNNITDNAVGLANEASAGTLDATLNWWDSQTGPSGLFTGVGDSIEDRSGATTEFIEYLCRPFPEGFASVDGLCSGEIAELRQLVPGRRPDLDPFGRFVVFESSRDMDIDDRSAKANPDLSQEVFLLDRRPKSKWGGICLGGLLPCDFDNIGTCTSCDGNSDCPGDPAADPIILNGECVQITQLTDDPSGAQTSAFPRITGRGKHAVCETTSDLGGANADGSSEVVFWDRRTFEKGNESGAGTMLTNAVPPTDYTTVAPSMSGRFVAMESNADPLGDNPDGNTEIFVYQPKKDAWFQVTRTTGFCAVSGGDCTSDGECEGPGDFCQTVENSMPSTIDGRRIVFRSTGDLHNDTKVSGVNNPDHNPEIFIAKMKKSGLPVITQVTDSAAPVVNSAPTSDTRAKLVTFSSNGDYASTNADGSTEIFVFNAKSRSFEQITDAPSGVSENPVLGASGRWLVFESTSDLNLNGATNRRVFQFDRELGELLTLSRLRFGTNQLPRIRRRRYVTWESTANLTGGNSAGEWVIFIFDRKKDD